MYKTAHVKMFLEWTEKELISELSANRVKHAQLIKDASAFRSSWRNMFKLINENEFKITDTNYAIYICESNLKECQRVLLWWRYQAKIGHLPEFLSDAEMQTKNISVEKFCSFALRYCLC